MSSTGNSPLAHHAITSVQAIPRINTSSMFHGTGPDDSASPVDQFITNTNSINKIYLRHYKENANNGEADDSQAAIPPELGALAVLGYMSAVESYFRALLRNLIEVDDHVRALAEPMEITFAAALYHESRLLAEALSENMSFAGEQNIADMLRKRIGIKGQLPVEIEEVLKEFRKVCEIRHCCVHRFGRLGSKNAVSLGMRDHSAILEKPFTPSLDHLQAIADLLRTFVKSVNNFVFRSLIERIGIEGGVGNDGLYDWQWTGEFDDDRERFEQYYNLFASKDDTPPSPNIETVYKDLCNYFASKSTRRKGGTRYPRKQGTPPDKLT